MWNDVTALRWRADSLAAAAELGCCEVVLMHMQGEPATMQAAPTPMTTWSPRSSAFLVARARAAMDAGVPREKIWLDPGIGFGKTGRHSLTLLRPSRPSSSGWAFLVLLGASRKSFLPRQGRPRRDPAPTTASAAPGRGPGRRGGGRGRRARARRPRDGAGPGGARGDRGRRRVSGRVLAIGGSDSSGGAGVQADIKTITMLGGYAATAITAITVQDTHWVHAIHPIHPELIVAQARAVLDDIGADAIKTGMLGAKAAVEAIADLLDGVAVPIVIDPVMAATTGVALLEPGAVEALLARLVPLAALLTPTRPRRNGRPIRRNDHRRSAPRRRGLAANGRAGGADEGWPCAERPGRRHPDDLGRRDPVHQRADRHPP